MYERHSQSLSRARCEEFLAGARIGRVIVTERAMPTALTVAFAMDDGDIVFRSNDQFSWPATSRGTVVAFQVDHIDERRGSGWSVVATGLAMVVTNPVDERRLSCLAIQEWVEAGRASFIRLATTIMTGRLITYRSMADPLQLTRE